MLQRLATIHLSSRTRIERGLLGARRVLIKSSAAELPTAADVEVLRAEGALLRRFAGPGLAAVLEIDDGDGQMLVLRDEGHGPITRPLTLPEALDAAERIARTLARLHDGGVVHGDINPSNVVWRELDGDVLVIDLGVAHTRLTSASAAARGLVGTVEYMAPEQTGRTARGIDGRADLYGLGVTLYEWLTGSVPFRERDVAGYVHAHLTKDPPPMRGVPEVLEAIVRRLLAKDPDQRYASAAALADDLAICRARLDAEGRIEPFPIGTTDRGGLRLSSALVQRDELVLSLVRGTDRMVLVTGSAGLGKSAVLVAVRRRLEDEGRPVIAVVAKNDDVPMGAIAALLGALTDRLLADSTDALARRRDALNAAIAPHGAMLLEVQPRLELVLGPQRPSPEMAPHEAELRRASTLEALLATLGAPTLLVDDAEHLDEASCRMLAAIGGPTTARVRLVVAHESWSDAAPLARSLAALAAPKQAPRVLALAPLDHDGVRALLEASFARSPPEGLVEALLSKSGGNPHALRRLWLRVCEHEIVQLGRDGVLVWDEPALRRIPSTDDVVQSVLAQLPELEADVREVLLVASILGDDAPLVALSALAPPGADVERALAVGRATGILSQVGEAGIAFAHPRVRSRLQSGASPETLQRLHVSAARRLARELSSDVDPRWFAVASHFHAARAGLEDADRIAAVSAERKAASMSRRAGAFDLAATHLEHALALVETARATFSDELLGALAGDHVEQVLLSGDTSRAAQLAQSLAERAESKLDRARARRVQASALIQMAQLHEGMEMIRAGLRELGVELGGEPYGPAIGAGLATMRASLAVTPPRAIAALPEVRDPVITEVMRLLFQLIPAAFQALPPLFVLAELTMLELTLTHGVTPAASKNLVDCGIIAVKVFEDPALALELADAAFALLDRFAPTQFASSVKFVYGGFLAPWREAPSSLRSTLLEAEAEGRALGDTEHAAFAASWHALAKRMFGHPLSECAEQLTQARATAVSGGSAIAEHVAVSATRSVEALTGRGHEPMTEESVEALRSFGDNALVIAVQAELVRAQILEDHGAADRAVAWLVPLAETARGTFTECELLTFRALHAATRLASDPEHPEAPQWRATLSRDDASLASWAAINPSFFGPFAALVRAERLRSERADAREISAAYDAVVDATGAPWLHLRAIACERHADYWRAEGRARLARPLLQEASSLYERWGAKAKVAQLAEVHAEALARPKASSAQTRVRTPDDTLTTMTATTSLDVDAIVKAVSAIGSEVKAERLYATLLATLLENAGAITGSLVTAAGETRVEARATVGRPAVVEPIPLDRAEGLARDVVRHVVRTGEDVILENAFDDERFRKDPHVARGQVRSLLCIAIRKGGEVSGALYVENAAVAGAFTRRHVEVLRILAGQAATSIENARMYTTLEEKVVERTRALASRNREILALLDHVPQGIFTFGEGLRVEQEHSAALPSILGVPDVAGRDVLELLFAEAELAPQTRSMQEMVLRCSFGLSTFMAELNWPQLVRTFQRRGPEGMRTLEIDWAAIADEAGDVVKLLASVRDVTAVRALEADLARVSFRAETIDQALALGLEAFERFVDDARSKIAHCRELLAPEAPSRAALEEIFRHLHTLKGDGRVFGLTRLATRVHLAEEPFAQARSAPDALDLAPLREALRVLSRDVEDAATIVDQKLGAVVHAAELRASRGAARMDLADAAANSAVEGRGETVRAVVREVERVLELVAAELGKPAPTLSIRGDALVQGRARAALKDALGHVFRNAIGHGIEPSAERVRGAKPDRGHVEVDVEDEATGVRIHVRDDGRGLPMAELRARARSNESDAAIAELVFENGVTTASEVTELSGRGIGMSAVRGAIESLGGTVRLELLGDERDGHRPFTLVITLPHAIAHAA